MSDNQASADQKDGEKTDHKQKEANGPETDKNLISEEESDDVKKVAKTVEAVVEEDITKHPRYDPVLKCI